MRIYGVKQKIKEEKHMKKILATIIFAIPFFTMMACNSQTQTAFQKENANSFAFEATTSLSLMGKLSNPSAPKARRAAQPSEAEIQEITQYLEQIDLILMNDNQFKKESVTSDREEYAFKEIITFSDFAGESQTYSLYYSAIEEIQEVDVDDDKDDDDIDDADDVKDNDEIEVKQKVEGIAVYEDNTYKFQCFTEKEEEIGEKEESMTFTLYQDATSYIRVEQELEVEEGETSTEYHYTIVSGGATIYDYVLEYEEEVENGKQEKEIELKLNDKFVKIDEEEKDGNTYLRVKYMDTNEQVKYSALFKKVVETVDQVTTVHYEYVA